MSETNTGKRFVAYQNPNTDTWNVIDTQTHEIVKRLMPEMYAKAEARSRNRLARVIGLETRVDEFAQIGCDMRHWEPMIRRDKDGTEYIVGLV